MTRVRKSAQDRKAEIVMHAIRLAGEVGPDRVTTQHLADAVGLTQPAIFRHFPNKSDIWRAVGEQIVKKLDADNLDVGEGPVAAQLSDLVRRHLGYVARNPALPAILFSRELHVENEGLRQHFQAAMQSRHRRFALLIEAGKNRGEFRASVDPDDAADLILAVVQGIAMRWSLEAGAFDLEVEGARITQQAIGSMKNPQG